MARRDSDQARRAARAIAGFLEAAGTSYASSQVSQAGIAAELIKLGVPDKAARLLVELDAARPLGPASGIRQLGAGGLADQAAAEHDRAPDYRAAYLVAAGQRVRDHDPDGDSQLGKEDQFFRQHQAAQQARELGAMRIDAARLAYGRVLGWNAKLDERTTEECAAADGKNFDPEHPPVIGLPGLTHINCRCQVGPPHEGAPMLAASSDTGPIALAVNVVNPNFEAKHPRGPAGTSTGGKFAPSGTGDKAATPRKPRDKTDSAIVWGTPRLSALNDAQMKRLSDLLDGARIGDPRVVALQNAVARERRRRGKKTAKPEAKPAAKAMTSDPGQAVELVSGDTSPFSTSKTSNWVAKAGGLPGRVRAIARAVKRKNPEWTLSHCIAVALNAVKYSAATGDSKLPGRQNERASTVAAHGAAVAHWSAMKASTHTAARVPSLDLAGLDLAATQDGSVPVSSCNDGPRVTGKALTRQRLIKKMRKRRYQRLGGN